MIADNSNNQDPGKVQIEIESKTTRTIHIKSNIEKLLVDTHKGVTVCSSTFNLQKPNAF